jgi:hypothetical protein
MTTLALMQMRFEGNNRMAPQGSYLVAASMSAVQVGTTRGVPGYRSADGFVGNCVVTLMSKNNKLSKYRAKRDFNKTAEPSGQTKITASNRRRFIIQKHAATRLHYDLRLELDGVFKSWAVTRGPSLDPRDNRRSILVISGSRSRSRIIRSIMGLRGNDPQGRIWRRDGSALGPRCDLNSIEVSN